MNHNGWMRLGLSALVQCVITTGMALITAGSTGNVGTIAEATWILAVIGGLVAAAKDVQAHLMEPPK